MKKTFLVLFAITFIIGAELNAKPHPGVSFNFFYSTLRPYGEWIEIDADLYAWRPMNVSHRWKPYMEGRWSWTRHGWYWDSYEPFGWAVYHYGRWHFDDYYGWIWIPDYEWGPAWVEWRYSDNYIGWAPLPPYASFHIDFGIRFSIGWSASHNWWNFVPYNRFCDYRVNRYIIDSRKTSKIFSKTKYRNNYYYDRDRIVNGGIDRRFVEDRGGYRISEREIRSVDSRDDYNRLRERGGDRIYNYQPSEKETGRIRNDEKLEVRRNDRTLSIERDKIATPRVTERSIERTRGDASGREKNNDDARIERSRSNSERGREINRDREEIQKREFEERKVVKEREEKIRKETQQRELNRQREDNDRRESQQREINRPREESEKRAIQRREEEKENSQSYQRQQSERRAEPERRRESTYERPETKNNESGRSANSSESRSVERRR